MATQEDFGLFDMKLSTYSDTFMCQAANDALCNLDIKLNTYIIVYVVPPILPCSIPIVCHAWLHFLTTRGTGVEP